MMSLKIDWAEALVVAAMISLLTDLWLHSFAPLRFRKTLNNSPWWYTFFFCWKCTLIKIAFLSSFFVQPVMTLFVSSHRGWRILQFMVNWLTVSWISIILHGLYEKVMSIGYGREEEEGRIYEELIEEKYGVNQVPKFKKGGMIS